jgi:hypothetical protein
MKPSEYLEKNFNKQYLDYKIKLSKSEEKEIMESLNIIDKNIINKIVNDRKIKLIELDEKFIDKKILKNKMKKMFKFKKYPLTTIKEAFIITDLEEEILKLLEE